jgi:hypothetical protein
MVNKVGWVMITLAVAEHKLEPVTVTVYVPAGRPVALAVVCIGVEFHE